MTKSSDDEELDTYSVELPQTWPDMLPVPWLGVIPIELGAFIFTVAGICMVTLGIKWALWAPVAWYLGGWYISRDYHAINKFNCWLRTTAKTSFADAGRHGGSSVSPNPTKSRPKGMRTDAV